METLLILLFAVWLVASQLVWVPRLGARLRSFDVLYLLPDFRFFAPTPGQHNVHLLYRDLFVDGRSTPWVELAPGGTRRSWHALWNEHKRVHKARIDLAVALSKHLVADDTTLQLSLPYLVLLQHVTGAARLGRPTATQFLLMRSEGPADARTTTLLFCSEAHPLQPEDDAPPARPEASRVAPLPPQPTDEVPA